MRALPGSRDVRLLVVEENELIGVGVQMALTDRGWEAEQSSPGACDLLDRVERFAPHCVLVDVERGSAADGRIDLIEALSSTGTHVVVLTAERRRSVLARCLEAGAVGWIAKRSTLDEVDSVLRRLLAGEPIIPTSTRAAMLGELERERARELHDRAAFEQLTHREALVLAALTDGLSADEIAREHYVALTTVRSQIRAVLQKLGVRSQLAAVAIAGAHRELLPPRDRSERDRRRTHSRDSGPEISVDIA